MVTPLAGVWIEITVLNLQVHMCPLSLPLRECGLKFVDFSDRNRQVTSLPLRECGLKYYSYIFPPVTLCVTPLAGVWIEIK